MGDATGNRPGPADSTSRQKQTPAQLHDDPHELAYWLVTIASQVLELEGSLEQLSESAVRQRLQ